VWNRGGCFETDAWGLTPNTGSALLRTLTRNSKASSVPLMKLDRKSSGSGMTSEYEGEPSS